jgi:ribosomal protein S12 methylthiotransferase
LGVGNSACVVFLGCPKNQVDSEHVLGSLTQAGYGLTTEPKSADLIVVTTCAFLQSAVRESEAAIKEALRLRQKNPDKKVVVAGCLVQRFGAELSRRYPEVDLWTGLDGMDVIPRLLKMRAGFFTSAEPHHIQRAAAPRVLSTLGHFAYLKIADGCDNHCTYCTIPGIRGRFRSRHIPDIIREAEALARSGVKELILVAQDTTQYGSDLYAEPALVRLLQKLARVRGIRWLRLMYAHPAHLTEDVIDQFASNSRLCRYVDLPIQHAADHLLEKTNRGYTRADLELQLESLRAIPDLRIRTTIIVGLPGETKRDFETLLGFIRAARFDRLSCYAYSPEPGTKAALLPGQVSPAVKKERVRRLMLAQAAISRANLKKFVGRRLEVIVDAPGIARTRWDAPEIDGIVKLTGRRVLPGRFARVLVTGSSTHDLKAEAL